MLVVRKVIALLAEGVRDGAAARAASDSLYTDKKGRVSCTLNIASLDLQTGTIVLTRNNPAPLYICRHDEIDCINEESVPLGVARNTRPLITEVALEPGLVIVIYTDGVTHAGKRSGKPIEVDLILRALLEDQEPTPQEIADALLAHAVKLDDGRPADDVSVVVLRVDQNSGDDVRRMYARLPID